MISSDVSLKENLSRMPSAYSRPISPILSYSQGQAPHVNLAWIPTPSLDRGLTRQDNSTDIRSLSVKTDHVLCFLTEMKQESYWDDNTIPSSANTLSRRQKKKKPRKKRARRGWHTHMTPRVCPKHPQSPLGSSSHP